MGYNLIKLIHFYFSIKSLKKTERAWRWGMQWLLAQFCATLLTPVKVPAVLPTNFFCTNSAKVHTMEKANSVLVLLLNGFDLLDPHKDLGDLQWSADHTLLTTGGQNHKGFSLMSKSPLLSQGRANHLLLYAPKHSVHNSVILILSCSELFACHIQKRARAKFHSLYPPGPSMAPSLISTLSSMKSVSAGWTNECMNEWIHNKPPPQKATEFLRATHQFPPAISTMHLMPLLSQHYRAEPLQLSWTVDYLMWDTSLEGKKWEKQQSRKKAERRRREGHWSDWSSALGWNLRGIWMEMAKFYQQGPHLWK